MIEMSTNSTSHVIIRHSSFRRIFQFLLIAVATLFLPNSIHFAASQTSFTVRPQVIVNSTVCLLPSDAHADSTTGIVYLVCDSQVYAISGSSMSTVVSAYQGCINPRRVTTHAATGELYIICTGDAHGSGSQIIRLNETGIQTLATESDCPIPSNLYVNPVSGVVYATCGGTQSSASSIIAINGTTISRVTNSSQCPIPSGIFGNSRTGHLYATCTLTGGRFLEISPDLSTRILDLGDSCLNPTSVTCNSVSGSLYLTCTSVVGGSSGGVVEVMDGVSRHIVDPFQCPQAGNVYSNDVTGVVYASCFGSGGAIAISTQVVLPMITGCTQVLGITSNWKTGFIYVTCISGGLISFLPTTLTSMVSPSLCQDPTTLTLNPNTGAIYAVCSGDGPKLIEILGTSIRTVLTDDQCPSAAGMYYNGTNNILYVACHTTFPRTGFVLKVQGDSITTIANATQCPAPSSIAANPTTGSLYVACSGFKGQLIEITSQGTLITIPTAAASCTPSIVTFSSWTNSLYIACGSPLTDTPAVVQVTLSNYNISTFVWSHNCPIATSVTIYPLTGDIFVACIGQGVFQYDRTGMLLATVLSLQQCFEPANIEFDAIRGSGYVVCHGNAVFSDASTSVYGLIPSQSDTIATTLTTATDCRTATFVVADPSTGIAYVSCTSNEILGIFSITVDMNCPSAYTFSNSNGFGCSPCISGTFRNYSMAQSEIIACKACDPGSVMPDSGSMQCSICPPGTFEVSSRLACTNCTIGWYSSQPSSTQCSPCDGGYYGSIAATLSTCSGPCSPGYWCSSGSSNATQVRCGSRSVFCPLASSAPTPVSPGMWSTNSMDGSNETMSAQEPCQVGSFCDGSGVSKSCFAGTYQNLTGQSTCATCDRGTISQEGASECTPCAEGYTSPAGSAVCTPCAPGTYLNITASKCRNCAIGKYSSEQASSSCSPCPPGQVASEVGASYCRVCPPGSTPLPDAQSGILVCSECPAGTASQDGAPCSTCPVGRFASTNGSFSCTLCPQGTASNVTGRASMCTLCAPGSYQSTSGQSECFACGPQHYSSSDGAISCQLCTAQVTPNRTECSIQVCPLNHIYGEDGLCHVCSLGMVGNGVDQCKACDGGYYTPVVGATCTSCSSVEGLVCSNGLASVAEGYWAYLLPADADGIQLYATTKCPSNFCPGSRLQVTNSSSAEAPLEIEYCAFPRLNSLSNTLCGQCVEGYIPWGDGCAPCSGVNGGLAFGLIVLSTALVLFLLRSGGKAAGGVTVLLYFVQIAALEIGAVSQWFNWLQVFNFKPTSISTCLALWNPYEQTLFSMFIPLILLVEVFFIACVHMALHQCMRANPQAVDSPNIVYRGLARLVANFSWNPYVGGGMSVLLFCYTQVATSIMQYLYCIRAGDELLMFTAPTVDCRSSTYHSYLGVVLFILFIYILGFPLAMVGLLWKYKSLLAASIDRSKSQQQSTERQTLTIFQRWGPLFAMYETKDAWFWQSLVLLRRALFALIAALLVQQAAVRFMLFSVIHFLSLQLHVFVQPYTSSTLNRAETISYGLLVLLSVLLTGYQPPPYPTFVQVLVMLLVVPPAAAWAFYVVQEQWLELALKLQGAFAGDGKQTSSDDASECHAADDAASPHSIASAEVGIELTERQVDAEIVAENQSVIVPASMHLTNGTSVASDSTEL